MITHQSGDNFSGPYSNEDLTATMRNPATALRWVLDPSVFYRMQDLKLTPIEVQRCLEYGDVTYHSVTPDKWYVMLFVHYPNGGDISANQLLVWLNRDLTLNVGDIRGLGGPG
jgi:hypothetical protein